MLCIYTHPIEGEGVVTLPVPLSPSIQRLKKVKVQIVFEEKCELLLFSVFLLAVMQFLDNFHIFV